MKTLSFAHDEAARLFPRRCEESAATAASFSDYELLAPSLCHGWSALDLVVHVRTGLEEMTVGSVPTVAEPDQDDASCWSSDPAAEESDPVPQILWLRRVAAAYSRPSAALEHLATVCRSVASKSASMAEGTVEFQGKRLRSGDFLATWVVELAIHQLDFGDTHPEPPGLEWTRRTPEAIAGSDLPSGSDGRTNVLVALGRVPAPDGVSVGEPYPVSL